MRHTLGFQWRIWKFRLLFSTDHWMGDTLTFLHKMKTFEIEQLPVVGWVTGVKRRIVGWHTRSGNGSELKRRIAESIDWPHAIASGEDRLVRYAPTRRSYPPLGHLDRPLLLHASQFRLEASLIWFSLQLLRIHWLLLRINNFRWCQTSDWFDYWFAHYESSYGQRRFQPFQFHQTTSRWRCYLRSFQLARVVLVLMLVLMLVLVARGIDADDFVIERGPEFISFFNQLHFMLQRLAQRLVILQFHPEAKQRKRANQNNWFSRTSVARSASNRSASFSNWRFDKWAGWIHDPHLDCARLPELIESLTADRFWIFHLDLHFECFNLMRSNLGNSWLDSMWITYRQGFSVSGQTGYFHAIFRPPVTTLYWKRIYLIKKKECKQTFQWLLISSANFENISLSSVWFLICGSVGIELLFLSRFRKETTFSTKIDFLLSNWDAVFLAETRAMTSISITSQYKKIIKRDKEGRARKNNKNNPNQKQRLVPFSTRKKKKKMTIIKSMIKNSNQSLQKRIGGKANDSNSRKGIDESDSPKRASSNNHEMTMMMDNWLTRLSFSWFEIQHKQEEMYLQRNGHDHTAVIADAKKDKQVE